MKNLNQQNESLSGEKVNLATTVECVDDSTLNTEQRELLQDLLDRYHTEVARENPQLDNLPMPFGCKPVPGFREEFICVRGGGKVWGFVGHNIEGNVLNETRLFVDPAHRRKGLATLLLNELVAVAQKRALRMIYFYNLTNGGLASVKHFEERIGNAGRIGLRFFYHKRVVAIVLEDEIGCSAFEERRTLLPCFHGYDDDVFVVDASGNHIFTNYGRLLDMNSGYWCCPFGYRHPDLDRIMTAGYFSHLFGYLHPPALSLARKLCKLSGMARVGFNTSGSSVIDEAIRLAWQYAAIRHGRDRKIIVSLKGGFYGSSATALRFAGLDIRCSDGRRYDYAHYLPDDDIGRKIDPFSVSLNPLEELIKEECLEGKIAAFVFEPILGVRGARVLEKEKLQAMMQTCERDDIVTIADEISTGLGRTGELFAHKHYEVVPDIICLGKPITNGMFPLAAVLFNDKVNSIFDEHRDSTPSDFLYGSTLGGHPTACMIALKVLDLLQSETTLRSIGELSSILVNKLVEFQKAYRVIRRIHGMGLMLGIELPNSVIAREVQLKLRKSWISCIPEGRIIMLMPPFTLTEEQASYFLNALNRVLSEVSARGVE